MGVVTAPDPVKPIVATLSADPAALARARRDVEALLGPVDVCTPSWRFTATSHYTAEMGDVLQREFWAFARLGAPEDVAAWKVETNGIEAALAAAHGRTVNLDPGYVHAAHVALASTKPFSHRVYLRDGIYVEVTLLWQANKFVTLPWTYPEYRTVPVQKFLREVRARFRQQYHPR